MRKSVNTQGHTANPGNQNLRILENNRGRSLEPEFLFDMTRDITGDTLKIRGVPTGSGNRVIKLPFWSLSDERTPLSPIGQDRYGDQARASEGFQTLYVDNEDPWTIDVTTIGINVDTRIGGLIDGTTLLPSEDYLVWAFMDPNDTTNTKFRGFGFSARPKAVGASTVVGGGVGSPTTLFSVTAGDGNRFTLGSRVVIREGNLPGDAFNQGIVTAVLDNAISVELDPTYGAILETNSSLTGLTGLEIIQLDSFEPYAKIVILDVQLTFGGFLFCYLGSFNTNSASKIKSIRRRGDRVKIVETIINSSGNSATVPLTTICLARWIPFNTNEVKLALILEVMAGLGQVFLQARTDADALEDQILTSDATQPDERIVETDSIIPRMRDCSVTFQAVVLSGNPPFLYTFAINLYGHTGDQSW